MIDVLAVIAGNHARANHNCRDQIYVARRDGRAGPVRETPVKPRAGRSSEYPAKLRPARISAAPRLGASRGVLSSGSLVPTWVWPLTIGLDPSGLRFASDPVPCGSPENKAR